MLPPLVRVEPADEPGAPDLRAQAEAAVESISKRLDPDPQPPTAVSSHSRCATNAFGLGHVIFENVSHWCGSLFLVS